MDSVVSTLPNRPIITVYRGWIPSNKRGDAVKSVPAVDQPRFETHNFSLLSRRGKKLAAKPPEEETRLTDQIVPTTRPRETGQRFDFVINGSEPLHTKDAATRRLVRSHAMKEFHRGRRERKKTKQGDAIAKCTKIEGASGASLPLEIPPERLSADNEEAVPLAQNTNEICAPPPWQSDYYLANYLNTVSTNVCRLSALYFTQLGSAMFPLEFHLAYNPPAQLLVLDPSFSGDAVSQSLAFAAAVCSTLAGGRRNSIAITVETSRTIQSINRLLEGGARMADGLLGAVCNLATGEALRGNFNSWALHMSGLKNMVEMRGGMKEIHLYLQMKIYRADLLGSTDQVSRPFFHFKSSRRSTIRSTSYLPVHDTLLEAPDTQLGPPTLSPRSANVLEELRDFSRTIEQTLPAAMFRPTPKDIIEAWYSIQYQLLSGDLIEEEPDSSLATENDELWEAFRLGAIIYSKEMLHNLTLSATGSKILASKLASCLDLMLTLGTTPPPTSLTLWLLFMGSIASAKNSTDRKLFVAHLVGLQGRVGIGGWEDVKSRLGKVLWAGKILDTAGREVWDEVGAYGNAV